MKEKLKTRRLGLSKGSKVKYLKVKKKSKLRARSVLIDWHAPAEESKGCLASTLLSSLILLNRVATSILSLINYNNAITMLNVCEVDTKSAAFPAHTDVMMVGFKQG